MRNPLKVNDDPNATWDSDRFEDQIAGTVIALYERPSRIKGSDWPGASLYDIDQIKRNGAFVQHPNRYVFDDELDAPLDTIYTGLFVESQIQGGRRIVVEGVGADVYGGFCVLKRAPAIPAPFYPMAKGTPYCYISMSATDDGALETEKQYVTVNGKDVVPCAIDAKRKKAWNYQHRPPVLEGESLAENTARRVVMLCNTIADRNHQWGIQAIESDVRVELQCYHAEIKSLLYARTLPITSTGRKRPILHLVSAHRRRMKEGIDIDIDAFLRGVKKVEMGGAVFEVRAPSPLPQRAAA